MQKAIFLDRDGTINVEKNYLHRIEEFEFIPGALEGLSLLQSAGYLLIIITNQSGIARGFYTEEDYYKLTEWMLKRVNQNGINIAGVYHCPHHPQAVIEQYRMECDCRKPRLGLFKKAIRDFDLDITKCYAIGDKMRDCAVCLESECQGFLIGSSEDRVIIESVRKGDIHNVFYAKDLFESACMIVKNEVK